MNRDNTTKKTAKPSRKTTTPIQKIQYLRPAVLAYRLAPTTDSRH